MFDDLKARLGGKAAPSAASPAEPRLAATATVSTPAIPLPSNNPEWQELERASTKPALALLDARLARNGYAVDGRLRMALRTKYEATP